MPRKRILLRPVLLTALGLAILLSLGFWQVQRLAWKRGILAAIAAAEAAPPAPLAGDPADFTKVVTAGTWRADTWLEFGALTRAVGNREELGGNLLQVLDRPDAPPLLVDRGWVPDSQLRALLAAGPARPEGYVRHPDPPGLFTPAPDLAGKRVFTLDLATLRGALNLRETAPFVLIALGPPGLPAPAEGLPRPPNDHLSYAITWFALAAALLVVFVTWLMKARRI